MRNRTSLHIQIGRDRISKVLEPHLGSADALERANNIAQALVLGAQNPELVARHMLRDRGLGNASAVAEEVSQAWRADTAI